MNVYERIVELLKEEPLLQDFKYVKSKYAFIKRINGIRYSIGLEHLFFFTIEISIQPCASVRYEVLHKWFEKFNFKTLSDQRDHATIDVSPPMVGYPGFFRFKYDGSDFDEIFPKFRESLIRCAKYTFSTFATMEDYYREIVLPVLEGQKEAPLCGDDWVFKYLTAGRILHPESYEKLKEIVMHHVEGRTKVREPNIIEYEGKWKEILEYLESLDFSSGKARKAGKKTSSKDMASPK